MGPAPNKMFAQWCGDVLLKVLSSFNVWYRGQDAASQPHHCANINVVGHFVWTDSMIKKIKDQLNKDIVQRVIYGLGLALWTLLLWDSVANYSHATSSIGLSYSTVYLIPTAILTLQIILNNRLLWGLIFGLVTTYIVVALFMVIADSIERSGNHVKAIDWTIKDIMFLLTFFGLIITADKLIYNIKPRRMI